MIKNRDSFGKFKNKYIINDNYFNKINSENGAYILGFIYADGNIYKNKLTITQSGDIEKNILLWIKSKLKSNHPLTIRKPKKETHKTAYVLTITSQKIINDLYKYGVIENKKYKLKYSNKINIKFIKSFIRGYFDGDGCVGIYNEKKIKKEKPYYSKYLKLSFFGTKNFIEECNRLLPNELKGRIRYVKKHAEIIWTNKKARNFGGWLFENKEIYKSVKYNKYIQYINEYNKTPILSKRMSKPVIQYDLDGNLINEYPSITYVKNLLGLSIGNTLIGITKTCGGYLWKYKK